jgi:hypothetical protein
VFKNGQKGGEISRSFLKQDETGSRHGDLAFVRALSRRTTPNRRPASQHPHHDCEPKPTYIRFFYNGVTYDMLAISQGY